MNNAFFFNDYRARANMTHAHAHMHLIMTDNGFYSYTNCYYITYDDDDSHDKICACAIHLLKDS